MQAQTTNTASNGLSPSAFNPSFAYSTAKVVLLWQLPSYFSQWSPSSFVVDGVTFSCAELYMVAEKVRRFKTIAQLSSSCRRQTQAHTNALVEACSTLTPLFGTERSKMPC